MDLGSQELSKLKENQDIAKVVGLIIPIAGVVISILIAVLIIWPKINEILELKQDNEQRKSSIEVLEKKVQVLKTLDQDKLEDQLAAAEQLLPSESSVFPTLRQVEELANSTGVLVSSIEVVTSSFNASTTTNKRAPVAKTSAEISIAPAVELRLSLTSDYQSLLGFVSGIYSFSRVTSIDSLAVSAGRGEEITLTTAFSVFAHWKELPQNLGSVEAPITSLSAAEEELLEKVESPQVIESVPVPPVETGRGNPFSPF